MRLARLLVVVLNGLLAAGTALAAREAARLEGTPGAVVAPTVVREVRAAPPGRAAIPASPAAQAAAVIERGLLGRAEAPRAAETAAAGAGAEAAPVAPPDLVGTVVGAGPRGAALFAREDGQALVPAGARIDAEWRLVSVRRGEAVVEDSTGRRRVVQLPLPG